VVEAEGDHRRLTSSELQQGVEAMRWALAERMAEEWLTERHQYPDRALAVRYRMSAYAVRRWVKTVWTFPPDQRNPELPFDIHVVAAHTEDPVTWLAWAADHGASVKELQRAIRAARNGQPTAEDLRREGEALVQQLRRWIQRVPVEWAWEAVGRVLQDMPDRIRLWHVWEGGQPEGGVGGDVLHACRCGQVAASAGEPGSAVDSQGADSLDLDWRTNLPGSGLRVAGMD